MRSFLVWALFCGQSSPCNEISFDGKEKAWKLLPVQINNNNNNAAGATSPATFTKQSFPWGLYFRTGHRLLCSDGKVRAAELAQTADTFFSVPANVRVNGKWVSGYYTLEENGACQRVHAFRHHTIHSDKLPEWPARFTPEHEQIIATAA